MSDHTHIQWTDATWNPVTGCSVVSAGCRHCYAMRLAGGRLRHHPSRAGLTRATSAGPVWTGEVRLKIAGKRMRDQGVIYCSEGDDGERESELLPNALAKEPASAGPA